MSEKIVINSITPVGSTGDNLLDCYFKPKGNGTFTFHDKDGKEKAKDLGSGSSFSFHLDDLEWTLTIASISDQNSSGTWSDASDPVGTGDQGYQAQAGTVGEGEEDAASATASGASNY